MSYTHLRIPLLTLLAHPKGRQSIKAFALAEHSEETISFVDDVEGLRQLYPLWLAEKESKTQQPQPDVATKSATAASSSSLLSVSVDRYDKSTSEQYPLSLSVEEDDTVPQLPSSPRSAYSPSQQSSVSSTHSSLLSPLHRHSVFSCRSSVSSQENVLALRDFTFHIADNPTAHPLPPLTASLSAASHHSTRPANVHRTSLLNTRGEALSVTSVVNEAATKIWQKYQPGAQFAISWHPLHLREVQAEIRRGGGRIDSPLVFNGQEEKEIENVQAGTLARYYTSREYARLIDDLLFELGTSVYNALSAQPAADRPTTAAATAAGLSTINEQKEVEKERARVRERRTSRDRDRDKDRDKDPLPVAGTKSSVVNVANILRFDSGVSSCSSDSASSPSAPSSPVLGATDSPSNAPSSPLTTHHVLHRGLSLRSLQPTDHADSSEEDDDEKDGGSPAIRASKTIQFLIPGRGKCSSKEKDNNNNSPATDNNHSNSISKPSSNSHSPEQPRPIRPSTAAPILRSSSFRRAPPPILRTSSLATSADVQPLSPGSASPTGSGRSPIRRNGLMECRDGAGLAYPDMELLSTYGFFIFHFNPLGSQLIRHFMTAEWSVDNYDFLLAVDLFSTRAMSDRERRKEAKSIYQMFLSPESKREVTFPSDMRNDLMRLLQAADVDSSSGCGGGGWLPVELFDSVLEVVLQTVRTDVFRRFLRSSTFAELNGVMRARYDKLKTASTSNAPSAVRLPPLQPPTSLPAVIGRQGSRSLVDSNGAPTAVDSERQRRSETVTADYNNGSTNHGRTTTQHIKHTKHAALCFTDVLNDPRLLQTYTQFCKREHSEENVLFYQDVSKYHSLHHSKASIDDIDSMAQNIYRRYIAVDASFELPLNTTIRSNIKKELNFLHPSMFDDAINVAVNTMREDSGKRFLRSEEFVKWHSKHGGPAGAVGGSGHSDKRAHKAARSGSMTQR